MSDWKSMKQREEDERRRVQEILRRDREYEEREAARRRAIIEVDGKHLANLADTVVEPTPEWLAKGDVRPFSPKQPDGTVRVIRTVRRVSAPRVVKMHEAGKISDEHLSACLWYRYNYEAASLDGRYKSSHISLTGNVGGGGGAGQSPMALHEFEAIARNNYRAAKDSITDFYVRFFEAIVIGDVAMNRAAKFARCRNEKAPRRFRDCCEQLVQFIDKNCIELRKLNSDD